MAGAREPYDSSYFSRSLSETEHDRHSVSIEIGDMLHQNDVDVAKATKESMEEVSRRFVLYTACSIHRVVRYVNIGDDNGDDLYNPKLISIGPFHHGRDKLKPMEELKLRYLDDLLNRGPPEEKVENLFRLFCAVRLVINEVKDQYSEKVCSDPDDEISEPNGKLKCTESELVKMLVHDGCFIIELLLKWHSKDIIGHLTTAQWSMPLLRFDLLLLENQIPFFVLESLYSQAKKGENVPETFLELALSYLMTNNNVGFSVDSLTNEVSSNVQIHHLLHLYHLMLNPKYNEETTEASAKYDCYRCSYQCFRWIWFWIRKIFAKICYKILPLNRTVIKGAVERQRAGVKFHTLSMNHCFLKLKFEDGKLMIPPLTISPDNISLLHNLLAFEHSVVQVNSKYVTTYLALMDMLIDTSDDVDVLQKAGIIDNHLRNHEEVALLFNKLGGGVPLDWNYEGEYGQQVKKMTGDMNEYCGQRIHRYRAILTNNYFSNPWSFIAFVTALFLFVLTFLQTFFIINPRN